MTAAKREAIREALKQYWEAGEAVCDARANGIAQAHGVPVKDVWREVRCNGLLSFPADVGAMKTSLTLSQVLSIVGQQTNTRKMHKCPLCREWKLAVKQKPGGIVVVKCWTDNGKRHAKGEVWGHIVEKLKLGAIAQPQEEAPPPPPVKPKLSDLPDWQGFPLDEGYANYKMLPANFLRALPVTEQSVGGHKCTTFLYLLPAPDTMNAAQLAEVQRYEAEQAARAPIAGSVCTGSEADAARRDPDNDELGRRVADLASPPIEHGRKIRKSTDSGDTFWQYPKDSAKGSIPYGLWIHDALDATFKEQIPDCPLSSCLFIVEGESDCHTLWFNGFRAIGISGKNGWKDSAKYSVFRTPTPTLLVIQEPGGDELVQAVTADFTEQQTFAVVLPNGIKDPSALWLEDPDPARFRQKIIAAVWEAFRRKLRAANDVPDTFANNDTGNAERLVALHGKTFRWLETQNKFYVWSGKLWEASPRASKLGPAVKDTVRNITNEKWKEKSASAYAHSAMVSKVKTEPAIAARLEDFDEKPTLLNMQNGTLDLETGQLQPFSLDDKLTHSCPLAYNPESPIAVGFRDYLSYTFEQDRQAIRFILAAMGYTLSGEAGEKKFFLCHGHGHNGKTTLTMILQNILGPHLSRTVKKKVILNDGGFEPSSNEYELARLDGARLLIASELGDNPVLNEGFVQSLTGGGSMPARPIRGEAYEYIPKGKLWIDSNYKPKMSSIDSIWNRAVLIPFDVKVREPRIKEWWDVIVAKEGSGILRELLRGYRDYREHGLDKLLPERFRKATEEFRLEADPIEHFLIDCCDRGPELWCGAQAFANRYQKWHRETQQEGLPLQAKALAAELKRHNLYFKKTMTGNRWYGAALRQS